MSNQKQDPGQAATRLEDNQSDSAPNPELRGEVTRLLHLWQDGDQEAGNLLWPLVEPEIRKICRGYLKKERQSSTLQTSVLLNEGYIRLVEEKFRHFENRIHFFGIAAKILRQVLVDRARKRMAQKRGGGNEPYTLQENQIQDRPGSAYKLLELDEALIELEKVNPRKARFVELRFFAGFSIEEITNIEKLSRTTVNRELASARLWLKRFIEGSRKYNF